jgi:signal transduction histidine kinase
LKLLTLTNRYYSVSIVLILLVGGFMSYLILRQIINHEFNQKLFAEKAQFIFEWHTYENLQETLYLNVGDKIAVLPVDYDPKINSILRDTLMYDRYEKIELPFRQLKFSDKLNGQYYIITITKSMLPTEDLIQGVGEIMLILVIALVLCLSFVSRTISNKIWAPFNKTISELRNYQISNTDKLELSNTKIDEFIELNQVLLHMIQKNRNDYESLKEFTENASHEIQTPLAIIKSKAELLLQEVGLKPENLEDISKIYEAANRLSILKQGLSMLAKMDNNEFEDVEPIEMHKFIDKKLDHFEELIELKQLKLSRFYHAQPTLILNNTLAYVLMTNLISNSIKHNLNGGEISITLSENNLTIANTGKPTLEEPTTYFQRFKKGGSSADSSGLGLALVKKICDIYKMDILYTVNESRHQITIQF